MRKHYTLPTLLLLAMSLLTLPAQADDSLSVSSPDGHLRVQFALDGERPTYTVLQGQDTLIRPSALGFRLRRTFQGGIDSVRLREIDETYTLRHGKTSEARNHCNELTVSLDGLGGHDIDIVFRVYDDAVAFRYVIPKQESITAFADEVTEFNFTQFASALAMNYTGDYSTYFNSHSWADLTNGDGYCEPVLVNLGTQGYALLTEADQTASTSGSRVVKGDTDGQLKLQLSATSTISSFPWSTPWRTLIVGDLKTIVESNVVQNLCPPSVIGDDSWVEPGCVTWNWGGEDMNGSASESVWRRYVDMAAALGWDYCLMDEGWKGSIDLQAFVNYCREKNVKPMLWFHQHDFGSDLATLRSQMKPYADQGIRALKIDFFEGDTQAMMRKYLNMMRIAADLHLCLDFHGCTRPTGWERTYPNLLTMEANFGGEMNLDWHHMIPASHQANLVVTRNVIGPMDFTPGKLATHLGKIITYNSWGNDLATMVLFESGQQCLTDRPENILYSVADPLYSQLPAAWDETRCIEASPSHYATLARRKGGNWFVGGVSAESRVSRLPLSFLSPDSTYCAYIYREEGTCRYNVNFELRRGLKSTDALSISETANGGYVVVLSTSDSLPKPEGQTFEAEDYTRNGGSVRTDDAASGGKLLNGIGRNTRAVINRITVPVDGTYALTLYYKLDATRNTIYVQAGSQGSKDYYTLETLADNDNSRGTTLAMTTVYVTLKAGRNIIYLGNEQGMVPAIDKLVVTPTRDTQRVITGVSQPTVPSVDVFRPVVTARGSELVCQLPTAGRLDVFTTDGRRLLSQPLSAGEHAVRTEARGIVIATVTIGSKAYATKLNLR